MQVLHSHRRSPASTYTGEQLSGYSDLLVLGESVPGGTTTALCVLRSLGYEVGVSSSYSSNPSTLKEERSSA